ncbi:MAG: phenylalanine--tRNA ligase beta subunit-related protein [Candidatus Eisenbacteria bacterium]|nr:phenylalanine--tRNA ligase beta subunit-related protein [Candidatus Eisenbacteria bacterium]
MVRGLSWRSGNAHALLGIVVIEDVAVGPSPPWLRARLVAPAEARLEPERWDGAVRAMLRSGGFRPTGRNRPAHEFLARVSGGVPSISNLVDVNNVVSLGFRIPASAIDAGVLGGGVAVREGRPGERYVFNRSGQELDLEGLLILCGMTDMPVASPVKDSLVAHVTEETTRVVFCAYGSLEVMAPRDMEAVVDEIARLAISAAGGRVSMGWIASARGVEERRPPEY